MIPPQADKSMDNCARCGEGIYEEVPFEMQRAYFRERPYHLKCAGEAMKEREQSMEVRMTKEHEDQTEQAREDKEAYEHRKLENYENNFIGSFTD